MIFLGQGRKNSKGAFYTPVGTSGLIGLRPGSEPKMSRVVTRLRILGRGDNENTLDSSSR